MLKGEAAYALREVIREIYHNNGIEILKGQARPEHVHLLRVCRRSYRRAG
jgi:REP element-mobilizing transposase RayT